MKNEIKLGLYATGHMAHTLDRLAKLLAIECTKVC